MKKFIGVKIVNAKSMNLGEYNMLQGWKIPIDQNPTTPGYLVEYLDGGKPNHPAYVGYISWCPKAQFEKANRPFVGMSFGHAVEVAKLHGYRIARAGWNGNKMFVYYVPGGTYPAQTEAIKGIFENDMIPYRPYLALKTAQDDVATWAPSGSDAIADDWYVVE